MFGKCIIVMGVSASGKSTIGQMLANEIKAKFIDGDDLHPKANILKMAGGEPLTDCDREPWLERIRDAAFSIERKNETCVIVCSALKKNYRDQIRQGNENITFIYLDGTIEMILSRISMRKGHFMKDNLLKSQFDALESPIGEPNVIAINIDQSIERIIEQAVDALKKNKMTTSEIVA
ncbi:gluconokinase [Psychromonas marina]|uniref:Gluconokinase n=1 Tax=Psychromonas marina TaxID=88364 RepID=A0ABQ6E3I4_9GAMM|nr:gluconokinase [Psychromonas marina]GLS91760.1 gluconokinase [Psychromonas marina]